MLTTQSAELHRLIAGYRLCATTEGKSPNAIAIVNSSVGYFQGIPERKTNDKDGWK